MSDYKAGSLLSQIEFPQDLREKFSVEDLPQVSTELRQYIIDVISEIGNSHFGASLGVVELTVALHYIFNTPEDQLGMGCWSPSLWTQNFNWTKRPFSYK